MSIKIIATISAKDGQIEAVKKEALNLIEPTKNESGCIEYQLFENKDNSNNLIFVETWESEESLQAHSQSKHFQNFVKAIGDIANVSIVVASKLG